MSEGDLPGKFTLWKNPTASMNHPAPSASLARGLSYKLEQDDCDSDKLNKTSEFLSRILICRIYIYYTL